MKKPIQIEVGEWYFMGCFIQKQDHPKLMNYYVWRDTPEEETAGTCHTFTEAKHLCRINEVKNPVSGWKETLKINN